MLALAGAWIGVWLWLSQDNARLASLARNTFSLAAAVSLLSLAVGVPLAMLLVRTDLPLRRMLLLLCGLQLLLPLYLQAAAWQAGLGLQGLTAVVGLRPLLVDGWTAVIWIHTLAAIPSVVLIVGWGLWQVEPELEEHGLLDASPARVFWSVTLRRARGAIVAAALWVAISTCGEMTVTNLYQVRTLAEELYTQFALGGDSDAARANAIGAALVSSALLAAAIGLVTRLAPHHRHASQRAPLVYSLGRYRVVSLAIVALLFALTIGVPLISLLGKAGLVVTRSGETWNRGWEVGKCLRQIAGSPMRFQQEFGWSLLISSLAACGAVLGGGLLAWQARQGGWRSIPTWTITAICLAVPGPLLGITIIWLLNRPGVPLLVFLYDRSIAAPLLAQWLRALPLATLVLWHAFSTIPSDLLSAAAVDGAGRWATLRYVVLPGRWASVATAWLLAFALALGELAASILLVPPGVTTLPIRIFGLIHYGVDEQVAGVCLSLIAMCALLGAGILWLLKSQAEE